MANILSPCSIILTTASGSMAFESSLQLQEVLLRTYQPIHVILKTFNFEIRPNNDVKLPTVVLDQVEGQIAAHVVCHSGCRPFWFFNKWNNGNWTEPQNDFKSIRCCDGKSGLNGKTLRVSAVSTLPYLMVGEDRPMGYDVEVMDILAKKLNFTFAFKKEREWEELTVNGTTAGAVNSVRFFYRL